jgi:hypothetical protein
MKKITIAAIAILLFAACTKESTMENSLQSESLSAKNSAKEKQRVTRSIINALESDPDLSLAPLPCGVGGGALIYGTMSHMGKVHGKSVNKTCSLTPDGKVAVTSEDVTYAANGDEIWTHGSILISFPTDGSTIATITGGSTIVGGTGRFTGATGYFIYENMVVDLLTGHESHTAYGEITY